MLRVLTFFDRTTSYEIRICHRMNVVNSTYSEHSLDHTSHISYQHTGVRAGTSLTHDAFGILTVSTLSKKYGSHVYIRRHNWNILLFRQRPSMELYSSGMESHSIHGTRIVMLHGDKHSEQGKRVVIRKHSSVHLMRI